MAMWASYLVLLSLEMLLKPQKVIPNDDADFAINMLHAMPKSWKQQYYLGHKAPTSVEYLLDALEKIEVAFPQDYSLGAKKSAQEVWWCTFHSQ